MGALAIIVGILQVILAIAIIIVVLLQSGKAAGLSGSIAGGAETFFGKNKGRTIDAMLSKYTTFIAIGFMVTSIMLYLLLK
ncbi:MAG: preprotein translocase subunit SecG [Clostridia bacterium]|nr:preprotein translocase subunit SecG [Clostridia bacterium]